MRARGTAIAVATLSGFAIVGTLAGCSTTPSMSAAALKELAQYKATHASSSPARTGDAEASGSRTASPTATPSTTSAPTPTATSTATTAAKPTSKTSAAPTAPTSSSKPTPSSTPSSTPSPSPSPSVTPALYTDGSYNSTGTYTAPSGTEHLRVTLTLAHDIITAMSVTSAQVDAAAAPWEANFEGGIAAVTVGKDIDSLGITAVAGSSLPAAGFNSAIARIKSHAQI